LRYDAHSVALDAIKSVASSASDDPEFHALAARFYTRYGQTVAAKYHLLALTQLKPSDRVAQLDLAQIELAGDPGRKDMALRARVRALADDPALRVRALSLLCARALRQFRVETTELVNRLQTIPDLGVSERLLLLEGAAVIGTAPSKVLEQLQAEVAKKPQDVVRVLEFFGERVRKRKRSTGSRRCRKKPRKMRTCGAPWPTYCLRSTTGRHSKRI